MPRLVLALALAFALVPLGCGTDAPTVTTSPRLYSDTFRIFDNPAEAYDEVTLLVGFSDQDGDMRGAELTLSIETADAEVFPVPLDDPDGDNSNHIAIDGTTSGTIRFTLVALPEWDGGKFRLTVADESGNESNEAEETIDVNAPPAE
jgi:hypothetical protein